MWRSVVRAAVLHSISAAVTVATTVAAVAVVMGVLAPSVLFPVTGTVAAAAALRYAGVYHPFVDERFRAAVVVPLGVAFVVAGSATVGALSALSPAMAVQVVGGEWFRFGEAGFLPRWWIAAVLGPAGTLAVAGSLRRGDLGEFPKPTVPREVAESPVYFGFGCAFFGLWAVLFAGIGIQRIVVVAPLFEELLKFGVALLVGSALFGRSTAAWIGTAVIVGSLFGVVEHATTYPGETDVHYLFRTAFHALTTTLSVATYATFAAESERRLQWLSPAYAVLLHFFHNTFAVLSTVISLAAFGTPDPTVPLFYGAAVLLLGSGLLGLLWLSRPAAVAIHRPLEHVLSDVV